MRQPHVDPNLKQAEHLTRETLKGPPTWTKSEVLEKHKEGQQIKKATKGAKDE